MKPVIYSLFFLTAIISQLTLLAQHYRHNVDMRIPYPPALVLINNATTVYYELYITNFSPDTLQLQSLSIADRNTHTNYLLIDAIELKKRCRLTGGKANKQGLSYINPGSVAVIYIEFSLQAKTTNTQIIHELAFSFKGNDDAPQINIQSEPALLQNKPAIVLGNPLQGGPWCAVYDPDWATGHRRVIYTVHGKARIPGRFAIDFIKLNVNGQYASGNEDSINAWFGYNMPVLAVADGMIAASIDTFSESHTLSAHPEYSSDKATGNYISLKISDHQFVFYEHLKPSSILVKPGQRVKKGQVIASLGFTGQTTGPHLHLHVANDNSPLGAEGLPFVFDNFELLGRYSNFDDFGKNTWSKMPGNKTANRQQQRPQSNAVISFKQ
jgi:hypothetical protein